MLFMPVFANIFKAIMSDILKPTYELAFHISSNLEGADIQKTRQDLEKILTSHGGTVSFAKDPEKTRLAYPIKHQLSAFFGYFHFGLESSENAVMEIRDEVRLNPNVLRFIILKHEPEPKVDQDDVVRKLASAEKRRLKAIKATEKPGPKEDAPKLDEKAIDEKLEEIIDKI